jgi:hypothetical protein
MPNPGLEFKMYSTVRLSSFVCGRDILLSLYVNLEFPLDSFAQGGHKEMSSILADH